jgi:predicted membrane protein
METRTKKILSGSIAAILCAGILIYAIESHRSLYQIFVGFILFVLPFSILSSFFSKIGSFIFIFISIMIGYIVAKFSYNDFWLGIALAAIIGGAIYFYITIPAIKTMNEYKPFSSKDYKENAKQFHEKK